MRIARERGQRVDRQRQSLRLQGLLQTGFRILEGFSRRQFREPRADDALDRRRGRIETGIQKYRAQHRLQCIRQYRSPPKTAGFQLALPQPQMLAKAEFDCDLRQRLAADEGRPQPRQGPFVGVRMRIV